MGLMRVMPRAGMPFSQYFGDCCGGFAILDLLEV